MTNKYKHLSYDFSSRNTDLESKNRLDDLVKVEIQYILIILTESKVEDWKTGRKTQFINLERISFLNSEVLIQNFTFFGLGVFLLFFYYEAVDD